ncbi:hypothetical protein M885DRAFT_17814 [Pelagophyceae sp. CCMP2097]|nr:hypothetical protein M885DRAFT_17814 [Pelagophyceae sp. CCMP2097]|mmetsp:Transcript_28095/g.94632  ORF Transcript_28095/g.94632 Transcript_28095/m.94632 type:complete len:194 (+) Transcript_28095:684-1265(+)
MSVPKPDPRHATVSFDDLAATRACLETEARLAMAARGLSATAVLGGLASTETCGLGAEGDVSLLDVAPSSVAPVEAGAPGRAPAPLRPKAAMFGVLSVTKARGLGNLLGGGSRRPYADAKRKVGRASRRCGRRHRGQAPEPGVGVAAVVHDRRTTPAAPFPSRASDASDARRRQRRPRLAALWRRVAARGALS